MPFNLTTFWENAEKSVQGTARDELKRICASYPEQKTARQKANCINSMMLVLDGSVGVAKRQQVMEECGRHCIGKSILEEALRIKSQSRDLDDLLNRLNEAHIGGGHLRREGTLIHASYDRCYCGAVAKTNMPFSPTYCHCSCGWYRQLFDTLWGKPVKVELLGSIIQGDDCCRFLIHIP